MPVKKTITTSEKKSEKQDFKDQKLFFNHRTSIDTKGPISTSSEGNSYIKVIVDAFTHYVALNPVPNCKLILHIQHSTNTG